MAKFIARRLLWMILVLFVVSVITFILMRSVPGGPFSSERPLPQAIQDNLNAKYNLDAPLPLQYLSYMGDIVVPTVTIERIRPSAVTDYLINVPLPFLGEDAALRWMNFGPSYASRSRSVNDIIEEHLPVSVQLGVAALIVALTIGIPLGIISALNRNHLLDYAGMGIAILGVSVPVIITGPLLQYFFGVNLRALPVTGWGSFQHIILPAFALGFTNSALMARLTRASLLQVLNEDYIRTARAKGLSERRVLFRHALKNALIPVVTIIGPLFAFLITGTIVTETIFGIPGLGRYFLSSILGRDYTVIMGTILLFAMVLVLSNLAVDVVYAWLDPRIRYD
ncbi:MAG: ABC transporter permease [bacterium]|nr:ABC transporter permease [bacterium]